jgi:hypothetical protein
METVGAVHMGLKNPQNLDVPAAQEGPESKVIYPDPGSHDSAEAEAYQQAAKNLTLLHMKIKNDLNASKVLALSHANRFIPYQRRTWQLSNPPPSCNSYATGLGL